MRDVLERDEVREVLRSTFYRSDQPARRRKGGKRRAQKGTPDHYDVICISMYKEDLARLDAAVEALKGQGHRKMSRSALIRFALDTMDTSRLPRSY